MAVPHRDDVPSVAARSPDHHHHPSAQRPRRDQSQLAIVTPIIWDHGEIPGEDFRRIGKIKAAMLERCGPLCWIEGDLHKNNRTPNNSRVNSFWGYE
jgi:hypothetical protein